MAGRQPESGLDRAAWKQLGEAVDSAFKVLAVDGQAREDAVVLADALVGAIRREIGNLAMETEHAISEAAYVFAGLHVLHAMWTAVGNSHFEGLLRPFLNRPDEDQE